MDGQCALGAPSFRAWSALVQIGRRRPRRELPHRGRWAIVVAVAALQGSVVTTARAADADPWTGRDKMLHATISAGLGAGFYALSVPLVSPRPARAALGFAGAFAVGATKELIDLSGSGDASGRDLAWDVVGALGGVGVATLIDFAWCRIRDRRREAHQSFRAHAWAVSF